MIYYSIHTFFISKDMPERHKMAPQSYHTYITQHIKQSIALTTATKTHICNKILFK